MPAAFEGRIELQDVVFAYPARPHTRVLCGLSLTVPPGQVGHAYLTLADMQAYSYCTHMSHTSTVCAHKPGGAYVHHHVQVYAHISYYKFIYIFILCTYLVLVFIHVPAEAGGTKLCATRGWVGAGTMCS